MQPVPTVRIHRNGVLALLGIVLLVAVVGAVWTVAVLRAISVVIVIAVFVQIVVNLLRRRGSGIHSDLFTSQSTFNATRHPRKQP